MVYLSALFCTRVSVAAAVRAEIWLVRQKNNVGVETCPVLSQSCQHFGACDARLVDLRFDREDGLKVYVKKTTHT